MHIKNYLKVACSLFLLIFSSIAYADGIQIPIGNLTISELGSGIIFPDNSVLTSVNNFIGPQGPPGTPGLANPMTSVGDMIVGGANGIPTTLGIGLPGQLLTVVSGVPAWATPNYLNQSGGTMTGVLATVGITETVVTGGTCTASYEINPAYGTIFTLTLNGACQLTVTSPTAGQSFFVKLSQSGTTAPTFGSTLVFNSIPAWSITPGQVDRFACICETTFFCGCTAMTGFPN